MQCDAHVIAWRRHRGFLGTVVPLSDGATMYISASVLAQTDPDRLTDAIQRRHAARWKKKS